MDLRRIVEEVQERRRQDLAMAAPATTRTSLAGLGATGSILKTVRDRMLREDPGADVSAISNVLEPESSTPPPQAPRARFKAEGTAASIAHEAARAQHAAHAADAAHAAARGAPGPKATRDDFLSRYLVLSEEFERRYKAKGWTDLVRKKCSSQLRQ